MTTFEVTVESAAGEPLQLVIEADNWVAAWRESLRAVGQPEMPADALCVVGDEGRVAIEVPSQRRRFTLAQVARPAGPAKLVHHGHGGRRARQPGPAELRDTAPDAAPVMPVAPGAPAPSVTTPDPIAKVLSDLERQRLLSRPLHISSKTGLPTPPEPRAARPPTPLTVPRPAPSTAGKRRPTRATRAFASAPNGQLPQEFLPVQPDESPPDDLDLALQWAADTAWRHVPCVLALVLSTDDGLRAEVVAARGEREREARGCQVACDAGPALLSHSPSLTRFSAAQALRFHGLDRAWDLAVSSVISVPIALADGELTGLGLLLVNAPRALGFTDGELSAVTYLAHTLGARL